MSKKVAIIGKGAWGKALHHVLTRTAEVTMYGRGDVVQEKIIVLAVPAQSIRELTTVITTPSAQLTLINTAKGIEEHSHKLPHQLVAELFPESTYLTLIGPGFANEVMEDMPTLVNLGYGQFEDSGREITSLFESDTFRVRLCEAIHILELSSVLKNIYAIGCGIADGLGYSANTRTMLTVVAIEEIQQLFRGLGLGFGPRSIPGTIGDVVLTCNSRESRNFSFGRAIVTRSIAEALEDAKGVVEGYTSLRAVEYFRQTSGVNLSLADFIAHTVERNDPGSIRKQFDGFIKLL